MRRVQIMSCCWSDLKAGVSGCRYWVRVCLPSCWSGEFSSKSRGISNIDWLMHGWHENMAGKWSIYGIQCVFTAIKKSLPPRPHRTHTLVFCLLTSNEEYNYDPAELLQQDLSSQRASNSNLSRYRQNKTELFSEKTYLRISCEVYAGD